MDLRTIIVGRKDKPDVWISLDPPQNFEYDDVTDRVELVPHLYQIKSPLKPETVVMYQTLIKQIKAPFGSTSTSQHQNAYIRQLLARSVDVILASESEVARVEFVKLMGEHRALDTSRYLGRSYAVAAVVAALLVALPGVALTVHSTSTSRAQKKYMDVLEKFLRVEENGPSDLVLSRPTSYQINLISLVDDDKRTVCIKKPEPEEPAD